MCIRFNIGWSVLCECNVLLQVRGTIDQELWSIHRAKWHHMRSAG